MHLKNAEPSEIDDVLKLLYRYQVDSIAEEDKADGFVTMPFNATSAESRNNGIH